MAASADETIMKSLRPNLRSMTGPYFLERSHKEEWGIGPMRLTFPMMGQGFGPGGWLRRRRRWRRRRRTRRRKEIKIDGHGKFVISISGMGFVIV